jgi:hypothetical protein
MMTSYMNTTGKCIELFYLIAQVQTSMGRSTDAHINVVAIDEELTEKVIAVSYGWNDFDYQRLFQRLPDGVHRVAVDGVRYDGSYNTQCGISLDDVTIMDCATFGEFITFSRLNLMKYFRKYWLFATCDSSDLGENYRNQ